MRYINSRNKWKVARTAELWRMLKDQPLKDRVQVDAETTAMTETTMEYQVNP